MDGTLIESDLTETTVIRLPLIRQVEPQETTIKKETTIKQ